MKGGKNKIAKKKLDIIGVIGFWVGILVALAMGALFYSGIIVNAFSGIPVLSLLPLIVHQAVGIILIGATLIGLVMTAIKKYA